MKNTAHLTEDQLDEVLMGVAEPEAAAHAAACAECGQRLGEFRASVAAFNQASMAWSEARSNTMPRDPAAGRSRGWLSRPAAWSYATASVLAAALLVTAGVEHRAAENRSQPVTAAGSDYFSSRQQEIATDNAMLSAISAELYQPVAVPAALDEQPGAGARRGSMRQVRN